nr:CHAT domain-containing protein [Brevundimonas sp.]
MTGQAIELDEDSDPGEALDDLVRTTAKRGWYIVLVIERFQSFASMANTATVSFLSQLRSLEHEASLTTIVISNHDCPTIRRRLPPELAFVNSAYGDNHDHAIMPPLTKAEFESSAPHIEKSDVAEVFGLGAGPDAVFAALIDESRQGLADLHIRTWRRAGAPLEAFARDLLGHIGPDEIALFKAALEGTLDKASLAHLRSLPLASFLFNIEINQPGRLRGELARTLARSLIPTKAAPLPLERELRLLVCSANPDFDLDIDREVRAIRQVADACSRRERIAMESIMAVTPDDFVASLRRFRPTAIHFSGHGDVDGILMRGDGDATHVVPGSALAQALQDRGIELVVLNACYSESQAVAIAPKVGAIVGTRCAVDDEAAIRFSTAFYRTLLSGDLLQAALKDGKDALVLYNFEDVYACHGDLDQRFV